VVKRLLQDWALALGVALALIVGMSILGGEGSPRGIAPPMILVNTAGGDTDLAALRGQVVVVNFWGTWCPPCRAEIPEISAWSQDHPDVRVLGVAVNSGSGDRLAKQAEQLGVTYDVLEATAAVVRAWKVSVFPTTFIIGRDGEIKAARTGSLSARELESLVAEAG
jgi:cytochrome c biogenesis protein CcmG, thiol:disulfide interchange protein DsbE